MSGRLLHYTVKPLGVLRSFDQTDPTGSCYSKPRGLWLSVEGDDDWATWCEAESFGDIPASLCYEVTLKPAAKVLRITTAAALLAFGKKYGMDPFMGPMAGRTILSSYSIDWLRLAKKYDGIIIAPYQWSLRLDERVRWYYGWDCASGCVWNAAAIKRLAATPRDKSVSDSSDLSRINGGRSA